MESTKRQKIKSLYTGKGCNYCRDPEAKHCTVCTHKLRFDRNDKPYMQYQPYCPDCCKSRGHLPEWCDDVTCFLCARPCEKCFIFHHHPEKFTGITVLDICPHIAIYQTMEKQLADAKDYIEQRKISYAWRGYTDKYKFITDDKNVIDTIIVGDHVCRFPDRGWISGLEFLVRKEIFKGSRVYDQSVATNLGKDLLIEMKSILVPSNISFYMNGRYESYKTLADLMFGIVENILAGQFASWFISEDKTKIYITGVWNAGV